MTDGLGVPRSLSLPPAASFLGPDYHFDLTRPGIGLYGGLPFADAQPVRLRLDAAGDPGPRLVAPGESVGYNAMAGTATGPNG